MKFVLDTNALYSLYGREKLGIDQNSRINETRLRNILSNSNHHTYVSTVTLHEIFTYLGKGLNNSEDLDKIRSLLQFIINKQINIINLGISDIQIKDLITLINFSNPLLKIRLKDYRNKKIITEAGFATVILMLQLKVYVNFYLEREEKVNELFRNLSENKRDKIKSDIVGILLSDNFKESLESLESKFKKVLRKAYAIENENEKKCVKNAFNNILYNQCRVFTLFLEFFFKNYENMEFSDNQLSEEFIEICKNSEDYTIIGQNPNHVNAGISTIINQFEKLTDTEFIKRHKQDILEQWGNGNQFTKYQGEYIALLFEKWIKDSSKYEKNDMLDMLILGALDIEDLAILSFDGKMQNYIFVNSPISEKYIKKCDFKYCC